MPRSPQVVPGDISLRLQVAGGALTAQALATALGVNQSTISRGLARMGESVVALGAARRARYALRRPVRNIGDRWPIYRIDANGRAREWARLHTLHGGTLIEWTGEAPAWAERMTDREGMVEGFPFFLGDLRPQGFLGRQEARRVAETLHLPADPRMWGDDDTLVFLQAEGGDLPGDVVVGEAPLRRVLARQMEEQADDASVVSDGSRATRFPELAAQMAAGGLPGSSAGGEQPKFLAAIRRRGGALQPILVKFSSAMDSQPGRRWADLLAAEAHALAVLAEHGLATAGARVFDAGGRRFLEVARHDRVGAHGRRGVVSLEALHAALGTGGAVNHWGAAAEALARDELIDEAGLATVRRLHSFGELIGNSDMHFGNLSFWLDDTLPFRPAPAYDMLPMLWAPNAQGEVAARTLAPRPPLPGVLAEWRDAAEWAGEFWRRVAGDATISREFRAIARQSGELVARMRAQFAS
jgi:hypothetical protein